MRLSRAVLAGAMLLVSACATAPGPGQLPVVEHTVRSNDRPYFAIFITGDGGWRKIDKKVSEILLRDGIPVVGLLSNHYFARQRNEIESGADLDRLIRQYQAAWGKPKVILVGYSRGADALPIMVNRLPQDTRSAIAAVALLGPALKAGFWLKGPDQFSLAPELPGLRPLPLICVEGTREKESLCRLIKPGDATIIAIRGGHHFGGDYERIGRAILDALKTNG